jgi:hypothetical protein
MRDIFISSNGTTPNPYVCPKLGLKLETPFTNFNVSEIHSIDNIKASTLPADMLAGTVDGTPIPLAELVAAVSILPNEFEVTETTTWQKVGLIRSKPYSIMKNHLLGGGQIFGDYDAVGSGAEVMVTDGNNTTQHVIAPTTLAEATHGELSVLGLPPVFDTVSHLFVLWARKNTATEFRLRGITFGLVQF